MCVLSSSLVVVVVAPQMGKDHVNENRKRRVSSSSESSDDDSSSSSSDSESYRKSKKHSKHGKRTKSPKRSSKHGKKRSKKSSSNKDEPSDGAQRNTRKGEFVLPAPLTVGQKIQLGTNKTKHGVCSGTLYFTQTKKDIFEVLKEVPFAPQKAFSGRDFQHLLYVLPGRPSDAETGKVERPLEGSRWTKSPFVPRTNGQIVDGVYHLLEARGMTAETSKESTLTLNDLRAFFNMHKVNLDDIVSYEGAPEVQVIKDETKPSTNRVITKIAKASEVVLVDGQKASTPKGKGPKSPSPSTGERVQKLIESAMPGIIANITANVAGASAGSTSGAAATSTSTSIVNDDTQRQLSASFNASASPASTIPGPGRAAEIKV
jgi:hypothetical protein